LVLFGNIFFIGANCMRLVTVATQSEDMFPVLQQATQRLGWDLVVLGWGQRWRGFAWRWALLKEYLQTLPAEELVVWCDAYDVLPIATPAEVETRYRRFGAPMVMSVEDPEVSPTEMYLRTRMFGASCRPNVFINGGLYMGTAGILREMIRVLQDEVGMQDADDDQRLLNSLCRTSFMDNVAFDHRSTIFFNAGGFLPWQKTWPGPVDTCFIHFPGHGSFKDAVEYYGYDVPQHKYITTDYIRRYWKQFVIPLLPEHALIVVLLCTCVYATTKAVFG
jgi:hypothetical protein